ncbi:MAG: methylmalonyl-CoA epimerase [Bacillota bacterium]
MISKVDHIAIAVSDLDAALKTLKDLFGVEAAHIEEVASQKVKVGFVPLGDTRLELVQPTAEDSSTAKFIATRGEGLHHIALGTDDVAAALKKAEENGARLIDKEPRPGAHGTKVGFVHPKSTFGTLIELVEEGKH